MRLDSVRELKAEFTSMLAPRTAVIKEVEGTGAYEFMSRYTRAFDVHAQPVRALSAHQPVVATGIHPTRRNDFKLAIRVQRRGFEGSQPIEDIQQRAHGEVDVRYVGSVVKRTTPWNRRRGRPLLIGASIGHVDVTAGTIGGFVRRGPRSKVAVLSNNHVIANENAGARGDAVVQPGRFDGGRVGHDRVASLDRFVALDASRPNLVDCAVARLDDVNYDALALTGVGALQGVVGEDELAAIDRVEKIGRTTGHTLGRVTAFELDNVNVGFDLGQLRFDGQIEIEGSGPRAFSDGGDSGSLIFTSGDRDACALLFAGSDQGGRNGKGLTYANPIGSVLAALKCELVSA